MRNLIHVIHKSKFKKKKTKLNQNMYIKKRSKNINTQQKKRGEQFTVFTRNESTHERPRVLGVTHTVCALNVS
jgi:hypothetical protein